jgi:serine/threonine protein kinase
MSEPAGEEGMGSMSEAETASSVPGNQGFGLDSRVPDHELLRPIGHGSYGEVWLARNVLGELRAVKIIHRNRFTDRRPFEREFEGIKRFEPISRSHPSQLPILHVGKNEPAGYFYYVMELADDSSVGVETRGAELKCDLSNQTLSSRDNTSISRSYVPHTLREDLKRHGRLPVDQCVQIGLSLATALAYLHSRGLVHRDIKPSNVMFVSGVARLGDIGLVAEADDTRSIVGTEGYIPPEGTGTRQADIFALGKVLYEAATGQDRRQFPELPADLRNWPDRERVAEFNEVLFRACAADARNRYQSAAQLLADLNCLRTGGSVRLQRTRERRRANTIRLLAAALAVCFVTALIALLLRQGQTRKLSKNPEALALYNQALYEMVSDTVERRMQAYSNLNKAIELDPDFVDAYYKNFEVYFDYYVGRHMPPHYDQMANFREATDALKRRFPNSAQYHTAQGNVDFCDWHFDEAIQQEELAIKLDPDFLRAHSNYGLFILLTRGDVQLAFRQFELAEHLDPNDVYLKIHKSLAYCMQRRFDLAIQQYNDIVSLEKRSTQLYLNLGDLLMANKQYDQALTNYKTFEGLIGADPDRTETWYARFKKELDEKGPRGLWQAQLEKEGQESQPDTYRMARLNALLGNTNRAFVLLNRAFNERHGSMCFLLIDDALDSLHPDPQFKQLLDKMNFHPIPGAIR